MCEIGPMVFRRRAVSFPQACIPPGGPNTADDSQRALPATVGERIPQKEQTMIEFLQLPQWVLFAAEGGGGGAAPGGGGGSFFGGYGMFVPLIIIFVLFYFMMIRPERRRRAEMAQMMDNLKKNDRVVTAGGILGTVVNVQKGSDEITIKIDESTNTKLRLLRSSIARVISDDEADAKKEA
jgi:preprotein translocase subunit YajC